MNIYKKKDYITLSLLALTNLIFIVLSFTLSGLMAILIDYILPANSINLLFVWMSISVVTYITYHIFNAYIINYLRFKFLFKKGNEITNNTLTKFLSDPCYNLSDKSDGYIINVLLADVSNIIEISMQKFIEYPTLAIGILCILGMLFFLSPISFYIVVICIPLYICSMYIFNPKLSKHEINQKNVFDNATIELQNIIKHKKSIKLLNKEEFFEHKFKFVLDNWFIYRLKFWFLSFFANESCKIVSSLCSISILLVLGIQVINSQSTLGELIFINSMLVILFEYINRMIDIYIRSNVNKVSIERLSEFYKCLDEYSFNEKNNSQFLSIRNADININNSLLYHINELTIDTYGIYHIKGQNGSGKSVLLNILKDILSATNIVSENSIILSNSFKNAAYLSSPYIFINDTVKNNILLGQEESPFYNEILSILNINFDDKVVDFNGNNLSYGEQQKIALARCFLADGEVIILDEPFVNLDIDTVHNILCFIENIKHTKVIILISHDQDIDFISDYIYEINENKLMLISSSNDKKVNLKMRDT